MLIPGTKFNKNRNKLFFFTGYEYFYQMLDTGLLRATRPHRRHAQRQLLARRDCAKLGTITASGGPPGQINATALRSSRAASFRPRSSIPNMQALMKLFPDAERGPRRHRRLQLRAGADFNQNNYQWMSRVDYTISDNTKLFVRYNLQRETQLFPVGLWWRNGGAGSVSHSDPGQEPLRLRVGLADPRVQPDDDQRIRLRLHLHRLPQRVRGSVQGGPHQGGLQLQGPVQERCGADSVFRRTGAAVRPRWCSIRAGSKREAPPPGCTPTSGCPASATPSPRFWGTHTIKAGFFWEWIRNAQPANNNTNGFLEFDVRQSQLAGQCLCRPGHRNLNSYQETSFNRVNDIAYNTYEGFVQDSWKVSQRLTLELGLRLTHFQPWV